MKFTPQPILIRDRDGFKEEDTAIVSGPFAIHRTRYRDWTQARGAWTVTHIPSGYCFFQDALSKRHARQFCAEIADLLDWNVEMPDVASIKASPEYARIRQARNRALGLVFSEHVVVEPVQ